MKEIKQQEIAVGEPVTSSTLTKIKENIDEASERLTSLEAGGEVIYPPIIMSVTGSYGEAGDFSVSLHGEGILKTTCAFNMRITGARLIIDKAGTTGTTEVDVKVKPLSGIYNSLFSIKPSVAASEGDDAASTNAVINPVQEVISAGSIIRLDITSVQNRASGLMLRIDYIKV